MNNVVEFEDGRRRQVQDAWHRINQQSKTLREDWLMIGEYLIKLRKEYPDNQTFGKEARATFPQMGNNEIAAAQWYAKQSSYKRTMYAELWPGINNPRSIRERALESGDEDIEESNQSEDKSLSHYVITTTPEEPEPEKPEIDAQTPVIVVEEAIEKSPNKVHETKKLSSNNPLARTLGDGPAKILVGFYTGSGIRAINYLSRQGNEPRKFLMNLVELIQSGSIGNNNPLKVAGVMTRLAGVLNARIIHQALPGKFAGQWSVSSYKAAAFKKLLSDAPQLWKLGEEFKDCDIREPETLAKVRARWYEMNIKPAQESTVEPEPLPAPPVLQVIQDATPKDRQQKIVICGKQYWPQIEFQPLLPYRTVWGIAQLVRGYYETQVYANKTDPASACMHIQQTARAMRLVSIEAGTIYLSMAAQMGMHTEQIDDPEYSTWPSHSGQPPEYQN